MTILAYYRKATSGGSPGIVSRCSLLFVTKRYIDKLFHKRILAAFALALSQQKLSHQRPYLLIAALLFFTASLWQLNAANTNVWRFRFGPFLEFGRSADGIETWAIRPLISSVSHPETHQEVNDLLWPVGTALLRGTHSSGRLLIVGWSDDNPDAIHHRHQEWLFPLYLGGETGDGKSYFELFPFYGKIPEILFMQDVSFTIFPFYLNYRTSTTERSFIPWPFYSRTTRADGDVRYGFFPIHGSQKSADTISSYTFWPFWTQQVSTGEGHSGKSQMLFPIYATTTTDRQSSWMAIPPFIYHGTVTNRNGITTQTRAPWPFYVREETPEYSRRSYWPIYGWRESKGEESHDRFSYSLWPFINHEYHHRPGTIFSLSYFFPFYYSKEQSVATRSGSHTRDRYTRVWPLWSYQVRDDQFRLRLLELWPMKNAGGIERNWAPFWTWFVRSGQGDSTRDTDIFWGLLRWGTNNSGGSYGQVTALVTWRRDNPDASREWRIFGLHINRRQHDYP